MTARTAPDPTKAVLSESKLHEKALCDYVINVATGCRHGCKFCYVPATPNIRTRGEMLDETVDVQDGQAEWGEYVLYRDGSDTCPECGNDDPIEGLQAYACPSCDATWPAPLADRLPGILDRKQTWKTTKRGRGVVGVSFHTDPFMDRRAGDIAARVVRTLAEHGRYCRVLTRNPMLAANYMDAFQAAGEHVTVGSSIPTLDEAWARAIEPNAPPIVARFRGLERFRDAGVSVYVSMSPTYPGTPQRAVHGLLERISELDPSVVFHEPINPRGSNYQLTIQAAEHAECEELALALRTVRDEAAWYRYACSHFAWVQQWAEDHGLPVHLWPDKHLVEIAAPDERRWLRSWRARQSPEPFADRDPPSDRPVEPPPVFSWEDRPPAALSERGEVGE